MLRVYTSFKLRCNFDNQLSVLQSYDKRWKYKHCTLNSCMMPYVYGASTVTNENKHEAQ